MLTFTPSRELRCSMDDDVKALVKVAVKNEQRIRPVRIHRMPNKRASGDFGVLSPYLYPERNTRKVEFHCREIFTWVRSLILLRSWNRGQVWKVARKRKVERCLTFTFTCAFSKTASLILLQKELKPLILNSFLFLLVIFPLPFRISSHFRSVIISDYRK